MKNPLEGRTPPGDARPHEPAQQPGPCNPYARVSEEERRRRAQELLARHARVWDAQIAQFRASSPDAQNQRTSLMAIDAQWREKQRELARAEAQQRQEKEISWQHSLRTDEHVVELRLGTYNPVIIYQKQNPESTALKNIIEMPVYVPVIEKLPQDLQNRNRRALNEKMIEIQEEPENMNKELEIQDITQSDSDNAEAEPQDVEVIRKEPSSERVVPVGQAAQVADNLAKSIKDRQRSPKQQKELDLNIINRDVIIHEQKNVSPIVYPMVSINSLTVISLNNSENAVFELRNIGDCSVKVAISKKLTEVQKHPLVPEKVNNEDMFSAAYSMSKEHDLKPPPSPISLLGQVKAKMTRNTWGKANRSYTISQNAGNVAAAQHDAQKATQVDQLTQKMIDKSATPAHLKILANRCIQENSSLQSKIIVSTKGQNWIVGAGDTSNIEFIIPSSQLQPGIILEEYDVEISPPCEVVFLNKDDMNNGKESVKQERESTIITIRCYGINSHCLELNKQIQNLAARGQEVLRSYYVENSCEEIVNELADQAIDASIRKGIEEKQLYASAVENARRLEGIVISCYEKGVVKAKYIPKEDNQRRDFIFDLFTDELGYNFSISRIYDGYFGSDEVQQFGTEMKPNALELLRNKSKTIEAVNPSYVEFCKNSVFSIKALSLSKFCFRFHYLYENLKFFDKFRQNSFNLLRKRLLGMLSDNHSRNKIVIEQTSESEKYLMMNAVRATPLSNALFAEFSESKVVQLLIDKLLSYILPSISKQIFVERRIKGVFESSDAKLYSDKRVNYDGNLFNLALMACSLSVKQPVWDIFNCLDVKMRAEESLRLGSHQEEQPVNESENETGFTTTSIDRVADEESSSSHEPPNENTPEMIEWNALKERYIKLLCCKQLLFDVPTYSTGEAPELTLKQELYNRVMRHERHSKQLHEFEEDYRTDARRCLEPSLNNTQMDTISMLLQSGSSFDLEALQQQSISDGNLSALALDIYNVLERELLYNETICNRTFLMLFYLDAKNINSVDPFSVMTKAQQIQLHENVEFLDQAKACDEYYLKVFGEDLEKQVDYLSREPARPESANKLKQGKKEAVFIKSEPFANILRHRMEFNTCYSEFDYVDTIAKSVSNDFYRRYKSRPGQQKGKKDQESIQITLHSGLNSVYFEDMEESSVFSAALELICPQCTETYHRVEPVDRVSMEQMLADTVFTIINLAALPKMDIFDEFVVKKNNKNIQLFEAEYQKERSGFISRVADAALQQEGARQVQQSKSKPSKNTMEMETSLKSRQAELEEELDGTLSSISFYPYQCLIERRTCKEAVTPMALFPNTILNSVQQLPVLLEAPVKRIGRSSQEKASISIPVAFPAKAKATESKGATSKEIKSVKSDDTMSQKTGSRIDEEEEDARRQGADSPLKETNLNWTESFADKLRDASQFPAKVKEFAFDEESDLQLTKSSSIDEDEQRDLEVDQVLQEEKMQFTMEDKPQLNEADVRLSAGPAEGYDSHDKLLNDNANMPADDSHIASSVELEVNHDFEHEFRIEAFRKEFDTYIDSLFTSITENAVNAHHENLEAYEDEVDDFETLELKMSELKSGELTYEEAGIDATEYQDPDLMKYPAKPEVSSLFAEFSQLAEKDETALQKQADLLFCLSNHVSLLKSVAIFLKRSFAKVADIYKSNIENMPDTEKDELIEKIDTILLEIDGDLGQESELSNEELFAQIEKYGLILGIQFELEDDLLDFEKEELEKLNIEAENVVILDKQTEKYLDVESLNNFLYKNPKKFEFKTHPEVFLLANNGLFGAKEREVIEIDEFIEFTADFCKQVFEELGLKGDKKKEPDMKTKTTENKENIEKDKPEVREVAEEEHEGIEEELEEMEKKPLYLRKVTTEVEAKEEVWAYLFNEAIERASNWFDIAEKAEIEWEKATNYLIRDWDEMFDY